MKDLKILHISDNHGELKKIRKIIKTGQSFDWIVLSGDIPFTHVKYMTIENTTHYWGGYRRIIDRKAEGDHQSKWAKNALKPLLDQIPHKHLFIVNGNHCFCDYAEAFPEAHTLFKGAKALDVDGVKVGMAVGVSPLQFEWHEEMVDYDFNELLDTLPKDIEVLITHAPANQVLDHNYGGMHIGYPCLYQKIFGVRGVLPYFTHLEMHLFGHAHESAGFKAIDVDGREILFSNAATQINIIDPENVIEVRTSQPNPPAKVVAPTLDDAINNMGGGDV